MLLAAGKECPSDCCHLTACCAVQDSLTSPKLWLNKLTADSCGVHLLPPLPHSFERSCGSVLCANGGLNPSRPACLALMRANSVITNSRSLSGYEIMEP